MTAVRLHSARFRLTLVTAAFAAIVLAAAGCKEVEEESAAGYEPSRLEAIKGHDERKRVIFTAEGARRVGLQTAPVRRAGGDKVVPYAVIIYDAKGRTYVYTSPQPREFVRAVVEVRRIDGGRAFLSEGPATGTRVVTVGATEVYGTELEIAEH